MSLVSSARLAQERLVLGRAAAILDSQSAII
jgi:hypothetical protein